MRITVSPRAITTISVAAPLAAAGAGAVGGRLIDADGDAEAPLLGGSIGAFGATITAVVTMMAADDGTAVPRHKPQPLRHQIRAAGGRASIVGGLALTGLILGAAAARPDPPPAQPLRSGFTVKD